MKIEQTADMPTVLVIFGATGDLASRKLIPALYHLWQRKRLPALMSVVGFSRREMTDEEWRKMVIGACEHCADYGIKEAEAFSQIFSYRQGTFEDAAGYEKIAQLLGRQDEVWRTCANKLFYLAVPPEFYGTILQKLAETGLTEPCSAEEGWTRVIVEKPFGKDLETAQVLDEMLGKLFKEEQIYRVDHYLGKETVQNMLAFRFSNTLFEPAWNNRSVASMHIYFGEGQGIEGRAGFYDGVGALRDVGQNHMLQMLALFTMSKPDSFAAEAIRQERTRVLENLEVMDERDVRERTVRGQYEGYVGTEGVAANSETETYFWLETRLNTPQWLGVPFYLESGKAVGESKVEVEVTFRHQVPCLCPPQGGKHYTNVLRYRVQPHEGVSASFWVKRPGPEMVIEEREFKFDYEEAFEEDEFLDAYAKVLSDAIAGDQTLFVSTAEILASWRFIDPIEKGWAAGVVPLQSYESGSRPNFVSPGGGASLGSSPNTPIGYVGLGKMGLNMVERLTDFGWQVVTTDPVKEARESAVSFGAQVVTSATEVVKALEAPRRVWIMVPHQVVDEVLAEIEPHLEAGDIVIDGGNSHYKESIRRARMMQAKGIHYIDAGVSGGPRGARHGACVMVGGEAEVYRELLPLWSDLAMPGGYDYMGSSGAGHFVKMVHNGIEYGMMQAIGEGFAVMKQWEGADLNLERIARLFNHGSVVESRLVGWLKTAYERHGEDLQDISGKVSHSGEGQWTVEAAKELGIPVPIIAGALQFRIDSEGSPSYTGQVVSALRNQFGGHEVKRKD